MDQLIRFVEFVFALFLSLLVTNLPALSFDSNTEEQYLVGINKAYMSLGWIRSALQVQSWLLDHQLK